MKLLKFLVTGAYWIALGWIMIFAIRLGSDGGGLLEIFHKTAFYLPSIAAIFVVSLQIDYLDSIIGGKEVNIRARIIDFVHWLMLISINVSTWLVGEITIWWLLIQLIVLLVIGASVGIGLGRKKLVLNTGEKLSASIAGIFALGLGLAIFALRSNQALTNIPNWTLATVISVVILCLSWKFVLNGLKPEELGMWKYTGFPLVIALGLVIGTLGSKNLLDTGWWLDTLSGIIAITLVSGFIIHDLVVIRRDHSGYQRQLFLKGIFGCNILILIAWLHGLTSAEDYVAWLLKHSGFTYVTIVGNTIYAYYYLSYEYHRHAQTRKQETIAATP